MKQTTNFPYDVAIQTIDLIELPQSADYFEYEILLPYYYLTYEKSDLSNIPKPNSWVTKSNVYALLLESILS